MSKKYITIMILPSDASKSSKWSMPVGTYKAIRNGFILLMVAVSYMIYDYGSMRQRVSVIDKYKQEIIGQRAELQNLSTQIVSLDGKMDKLKFFDKKLRIIAKLEVPERSSRQLLGMGGANEEDFFTTAEERRNDLVSRMKGDIGRLDEEALIQETSFVELQEFLMKKSSLLASTPSIMPAKGWHTSSYGKRISPFTGRVQNHNGMDIANRVGSIIITPADGIVTKVKRMPALGKMVEISHGYGMKTRYGHLSESKVKVGQKIKRGDMIAFMGNTGRSTGPHLHYEVLVNGVHVNPNKYVLD